MRDRDLKGRRSIERWNSPQDIANGGMFVQIKREEQASIHYDGCCARFRISPDPASSEYVASRISEIDTRLRVDQRVKPWQPIRGKVVEGRFEVRFLQEQTALTYNLMMWNAPFGKEKLMPATSIGVTRSIASGFECAVVIAQDVTVNPQSGSFGGDVLRVVKLSDAASWLDMTAWHQVHIMFAENWARVDIHQGAEQTAVEEKLIEPVEALGFEFSVDNEIFPGRYIPASAQEQEGFDLAYFEVGYNG